MTWLTLDFVPDACMYFKTSTHLNCLAKIQMSLVHWSLHQLNWNLQKAQPRNNNRPCCWYSRFKLSPEASRFKDEPSSLLTNYASERVLAHLRVLPVLPIDLFVKQGELVLSRVEEKVAIQLQWSSSFIGLRDALLISSPRQFIWRSIFMPVESNAEVEFTVN